jgi:hypothetical protein
MKLLSVCLTIVSFIGLSWFPIYAELKQTDRLEWQNSKQSVLFKINQIKPTDKKLKQQLYSIDSDIRAIDDILVEIDTKQIDCALNKAALERLIERLRFEPLPTPEERLENMQATMHLQLLQRLQEDLQRMYELLSRMMKNFHCMQMKPIQNQR